MCNSPAPANGGNPCAGASTDQITCNEGLCPGIYTILHFLDCFADLDNLPYKYPINSGLNLMKLKQYTKCV